MSLLQPVHRTLRDLLFRLAMAAGVFVASADPAQAQAPADPFNYTRTSAFTYYGPADGAKNGMLKSETIEPDAPQLCVVSTYEYDLFGNRERVTTSNCPGASGTAVFEPRTNTQVHADGRFPTESRNAVGHGETRQYDPRYGALLNVKGPNQLDTRWDIDAFGRKEREWRADGTSTVIAYCWLQEAGRDTSSNSTLCVGLLQSVASGGEVPPEAVMFVHSEPRGSNDARIGPFTRVYTDRLGRTVRTVTEGFDGEGQPANLRGGLVVRDVAYGAWGQKVIETQPYFLATSAATTVGGFQDYGIRLTIYDALGRPTSVYTADPAGSQISVNYGARGSRRSSLQRFEYEGLLTKLINDKNQVRIEERNVDGKVVRVTDASGSQIAHQHDAFGNLIATKDALQNTISIAYDVRGRKVRMNDPDAGLTTYAYDALGQLREQQNANQRAAGQPSTSMAYDKLGRMIRRTSPEFVSTWIYDECVMGKGKLCAVNLSHGVNRQFVYDNKGRPSSARTTVVNGGPSFANAVRYHEVTGRVSTQTFPTGLAVRYDYTPRGYPEKVGLVRSATITPSPGSPSGAAQVNAGAVLWTALKLSAAGAIELQSTRGGTFTTTTIQSATGLATSIKASGAGGNVQDQSFAWDSLGNLLSRLDSIGDGNTGAVSEVFTYGDALNRLTGYTVSAPAIPNLSRSVTMQYNALGMLLYKSDVGVYRYGAQGVGSVRPHALLGVTANTTTTYNYDANGNLVGASDGDYRSIAYTSFNLPDSQSGVAGPGGLPRYTWQYDENHQRFKETRVTSLGTRTTWSLHPDNQGGLAFEREEGPNGVSNRHYISVAGRVVGVLVTTGGLPDLGNHQAQAPVTVPPELPSVALVKLEYWHTDHLGSLVATTDHAGVVTARYAYDPFGKRRYTNGRYDDFGNLVVDWSNGASGTDRGYTGHEHLDDVGLVHMNGRIFDPRLGVMLQADPFIQDPNDLQNYNRYSYCLNNPLICTDPSGYISLRKLLRVAVTIAVGWYVPQLALSMMTPAAAISSTAFGLANGVVAYSTVQTISAAAIGGFAAGAVSTGTLKGAIQGAVVGSLFGAAAEVGGANSFARAAAHGGAGCIQGHMSGAGCVRAGLSAGFAKYVGANYGHSNDPFIEGIKATAIGGTTSVIGGGKFENGAATAAWGYLFNECMHTRMCGAEGGYDVQDSIDARLATPGADAIEGVYPEAALLPARGAVGFFQKVASWFRRDQVEWPPNNGFAGEPQSTTLQPGTVIDRYGASNGVFASPAGTSFGARSLPAQAASRQLTTYEVVQPIQVQAGRAASWFGQPGGGTQYLMPRPISELIKDGILSVK